MFHPNHNIMKHFPSACELCQQSTSDTVLTTAETVKPTVPFNAGGVHLNTVAEPGIFFHVFFMFLPHFFLM